MISIKVTLDCNGQCRACYENRARPFHNNDYDINAILTTLEREIKKIPEGQRKYAPCLHGGEPLIIRTEDLEKLLEKTYRYFGYTSIQTNGVNITNEHIKLFQKYKTHCGFSIDGDTWQLNYGRWNKTKFKTKDIQNMTDKVLNNLKRVKMADLRASIIIVLRRYNASPERLSELIRFMKRLKDEFYIVDGRTIPVTVYEPQHREEEELTNEELANAYCEISDWVFSNPELMWQDYREMIGRLLGKSDGVCVYNKCDPWKTSAEQPINNDGLIINCLRSGASVDGIQALAGDSYSYERYDILIQTPQELGGCKGCRYWRICHGGCPGQGIENDWRNKTRFCEAYQAWFKYLEKKIIGLFPSKKEEIEKRLKGEIENKNQGYNDFHGDRHGDSPHGDHTDRK